MSLDDNKQKVVKETVFTSFVGLDSIVRSTLKPSDYKNVLHIGYDRHYGDVFKCWDNNINEFTLFFGTAGDEFKKQ